MRSHFAGEQREYHRARAATCTKHHGSRQPAIPPGRSGIEIGKETFDVGIGRAQFAIVIPKCIGGADRAGALIGLGQFKSRFLVRYRNVGADIAIGVQILHKIGEFLGRHRLAPIFGVDLLLLDPVVVD